MDVITKAHNLLVDSIYHRRFQPGVRRPPLAGHSDAEFADYLKNMLEVASDFVMQEYPKPLSREYTQFVLLSQLAIVCSIDSPRIDSLFRQPIIRQFEDSYAVQRVPEEDVNVTTARINNPFTAGLFSDNQPTITHETHEFTHKHPETQFLDMVDKIPTTFNAVTDGPLVDLPESYSKLMQYGQGLLRTAIERAVFECRNRAGMVGPLSLVHNFTNKVPYPFGNPNRIGSLTICRSLPWHTLVLMPHYDTNDMSSVQPFVLNVHPSGKTCLVHTRLNSLIKIELMAKTL